MNLAAEKLNADRPACESYYVTFEYPFEYCALEGSLELPVKVAKLII